MRKQSLLIGLLIASCCLLFIANLRDSRSWHEFNCAFAFSKSEQRDVPKLVAGFHRIMDGLEQLGFTRTEFSNTTTEISAAYYGRFEGVRKVSVKLHCCKLLTPVVNHTRESEMSVTASSPHATWRTDPKVLTARHNFRDLIMQWENEGEIRLLAAQATGGHAIQDAANPQR